MKSIIITVLVGCSLSLYAQEFFKLKVGPAPEHLVPYEGDLFRQTYLLATGGFDIALYMRDPSFGKPAALAVASREGSFDGGFSFDSESKSPTTYEVTVMELNRRVNILSDEDLVRKKYSS